MGANGGSGTFSGAIVQVCPTGAAVGTAGSPIVALTKNGTGLQVLTGANTYTGGTTISMIGSLISSLTYLEDKFTVRAAGIPVTSRREAASRLPS
jgi:autotransporter-associated beta strand protein